MKLKDWIIEESENWIVLNKPSGLLSIPDREGKDISLKKILQENFEQVFTVHRLDKDTSGLILFAKNELAHKQLSLQFELRQTVKIYFGLVHGSLLEKKKRITAAIAEHPSKRGIMTINPKGKESVTEYEVLEEFGICSWVQFNILTGRTHQIRVHMKDTGHPILCDGIYGDGKPLLLSSMKKKFTLSKKYEKEKPLLNRLALHAGQLKFVDLNGKMKELEAPIPKDLIATLNQLKKWKRQKTNQ